MRRYFIYAAVISTIMTLTLTCLFAQGEGPQAASKNAEAQAGVAAQQTEAGTVPAPEVKEEEPKMSELSIYGEVQSVNVSANSMSVQYYDYDNDEEKTAEITLDSNSKLENVKAIGEIKKGDWVDVAYTSAAGKNTAKMVSVEKEEPAQEESAPAVEQ
jgi:hypothetical protein